MTEWYEHFNALYNPPSNIERISYAEPLNLNTKLDHPFVLEELHKVLSNAKSNKAPGNDRIPVEFYQNAPSNFHTVLLKVFNEIFLTGNVSFRFKEAIVCPIYKKGDKNHVSNYRGISLLNSIGKLYCGLILNRITDWADEEGIIREFQAGFRLAYSTADNIFNLTSIVKLTLRVKRKKSICLLRGFPVGVRHSGQACFVVQTVSAGYII